VLFGLIGIFAVALYLLLLALDLLLVRAPMVAGALGVIAAKCLQAAVNRLREDLADASAVQYTRYPIGLAGVLKKIGGLPKGGTIDHELAPHLCHMCFETPLRRGVFSLRTHPPLSERIRKLEPGFAGDFAEPQPLAEIEEALYSTGRAPERLAAGSDPALPAPGRSASLSGPATQRPLRVGRRSRDPTRARAP
jgi:Peptidase family M48